MQPRLDALKTAPAAYQAMLAMETYVRKSSFFTDRERAALAWTEAMA